MEEVMHFIFNFLAAAVGIYSLLIFIRIIISWFGDSASGRPVELLYRVTDPYLDCWRNILNLRLGFIDLSPVVAVAFLSLLQKILYNLSRFERISAGNIIANIFSSLWSIVSFILGFCLIVIVLRLIAYITNRDMYSSFWRVIDTISQPLLYRTNRMLFGKRIPGYLRGIITSIIVLSAIWAVGSFVMPQIAGFIARLPF